LRKQQRGQAVRIRSVLERRPTKAPEPYIPFRIRVSECLRGQRKQLGWTLERLATEIVHNSKGEIKSISTAHLSRIENDRARPSDEELFWINKALGDPIRSLFNEEPESPWYIVRRDAAERRLKDIANGRVRLTRHDNAHRKMVEDLGKYRYVSLDPDGGIGGESSQEMIRPQNRVSLLEIAFSDMELMEEPDVLDQHPGQEVIFCLEGEIEFWCQSRTHEAPWTKTLEPGDLVRFDSHQRHGFRAKRPEGARALHIFADVRPPDAPPLVSEKKS